MAIPFDPQSFINSGLCDTEIPTGVGGDGNPFNFADDGLYATGGNRWFYKCTGGIAGRSQHMRHQTLVAGVTSTYVVARGITPPSVATGEIWYLAVFQKLERVAGLDIHQRSPGAGESIDKSYELGGAAHTIRMTVYTGTAGNQTQPVPAGRYYVVVGNTTHHLHPELEVGFGYYPNNVAPYTTAAPYPLDYDRWYAIVLELKASTTTTGHLKLYINGTKITELLNIKTWAPGAMTIPTSDMYGTIAQPTYDAPIHARNVDGWIVTDELGTLQGRAYFSDPTIQVDIPVIGRRRTIFPM